MDLPDLPARLHAARDSMEQVHECQAPVFLHTELEDGAPHIDLDIPVESPTVRGYGSILVKGLAGASVEAIGGVGGSNFADTGGCIHAAGAA